jgi:hypothetical protein
MMSAPRSKLFCSLLSCTYTEKLALMGLAVLVFVFQFLLFSGVLELFDFRDAFVTGI